MMIKIANFLKNLKKNDKGFTLIELMVVIAVLGILAALIIPQFSNVSKKAKLSNAASTASAVASATAMYYAEHSQTVPGTEDGTTKYTTGLEQYMSNITTVTGDYDVYFNHGGSPDKGWVKVVAKDPSDGSVFGEAYYR